MTYTFNESVSLQENILEIEVYGQQNKSNKEEEIRNHLLDINIDDEDIDKLIIAYKRGLKEPN